MPKLYGSPNWSIAQDRWTCPKCDVTFVSRFKDLRLAGKECRAARDSHKCRKPSG